VTIAIFEPAFLPVLTMTVRILLINPPMVTSPHLYIVFKSTVLAVAYFRSSCS